VRLDDLEHHPTAVLEEPLWGRVDVVVAAGVRAANDHDSCARVVVEDGVVDGGAEKVGVCL